MNKPIACSILAIALLTFTLAGSGLSGSKAFTGDAVSSTIASPEVSSPAAPSPTPPSDAVENSATSWLPSGVIQVLSETERNADLEKAIVNFYQIPDNQLASTKYNYNYVDLNNDGTDEILAVVAGPNTSESSGDSMLLLLPYANMAVAQSFTGVSTPIIITKEATNGQQYGSKGLIFQHEHADGALETVILENNDGEYPNVSDGKVIEDLSAVEGTAIICNDLIADAQNGTGLTLAK